MRFKTFASAAAVAVAVAGLAGFSGVANAESDFSTTGTAQARLDFRIVIPSILLLEVGAPGATINELVFTPSGVQVEAGTPVTGSGGNEGGSVVSVRVFGNDGQVTLNSFSDAQLTSGSETIPWTEILVAATGGIAHPAFTADGAMSAPSTPSPGPGGRITNQSGTWEYTFNNSNAAVAAGTYTGRVTYTASMP